MNRKLLFFDVDGTICSRYGKVIPESTVTSIAKARANGHLAFINSGRPYINIEKCFRDIGFDGYVCGCGGAIVYQDEVIFHKGLNHEESWNLAMQLRESGVHIFYEEHDCLYYDPAMADEERYLRIRDHFAGVGEVRSIEEPDFHTDKLWGWYNDITDKKTADDVLSQYFDVMHIREESMECQIKGCSKSTAIQYLQEKFGISNEDTYVFGDSVNDLPMMDYCVNSICMGDPEEEFVKEHASFVTKPQDEDGIEYALKHFGLID